MTVHDTEANMDKIGDQKNFVYTIAVPNKIYADNRSRHRFMYYWDNGSARYTNDGDPHKPWETADFVDIEGMREPAITGRSCWDKDTSLLPCTVKGIGFAQRFYWRKSMYLVDTTKDLYSHYNNYRDDLSSLPYGPDYMTRTSNAGNTYIMLSGYVKDVYEYHS